jgi:hypothetical protein
MNSVQIFKDILYVLVCSPKWQSYMIWPSALKRATKLHQTPQESQGHLDEREYVYSSIGLRVCELIVLCVVHMCLLSVVFKMSFSLLCVPSVCNRNFFE